MKWSWKLGTFAGIDVFIHASFLLIIAFVGFTSWQQTRTVDGMLQAILFTLLLFTFVVLHEYGHALTARRYGIKTRDITLYPIGGVARLERIPEKPIQEFWVALAGPAVNVGIASLLFVWLWFSGTFMPMNTIGMTSGPFIERLMIINIGLVLFNLIPAFPMDGGRVLRALLAMRLEYAQATQIAAIVGQGMAVLFVLAGFLGNPSLLLIGFFVWIGAAQEASMTRIKSTLQGIPVENAMLVEFQTLAPQDNLSRAVAIVLASSQTEFPVTSGQTLAGWLSRSDLLTALSRLGADTPVSQVMRREIETIDAGTTLESAILRLQASGLVALPVVHHGQLVGLLTADNLSEFLMIQTALKRAGTRSSLASERA